MLGLEFKRVRKYDRYLGTSYMEMFQSPKHQVVSFCGPLPPTSVMAEDGSGYGPGPSHCTRFESQIMVINVVLKWLLGVRQWEWLEAPGDGVYKCGA